MARCLKADRLRRVLSVVEPGIAEAPVAKPATNKTEAVAQALPNELQRVAEAIPLRARLRPIQDRVMSRPATGRQTDKAFFDELSGDL